MLFIYLLSSKSVFRDSFQKYIILNICCVHTYICDNMWIRQCVNWLGSNLVKSYISNKLSFFFFNIIDYQKIKLQTRKFGMQNTISQFLFSHPPKFSIYKRKVLRVEKKKDNRKSVAYIFSEFLVFSPNYLIHSYTVFQNFLLWRYILTITQFIAQKWLFIFYIFLIILIKTFKTLKLYWSKE